MKFDYWHIRRFFRLADMNEGETLTFGGPPFVVGRVVTCPEPVWRTVVSTTLSQGVSDSLACWTWQNPLSPQDSRNVSQSLGETIHRLEQGANVQYPPDQDEDDLLDKETVLALIYPLRDLLVLAVQRGSVAETWSE
ncbi:hypothetical protein P6B95_24210 [Streptomyces atratus]|uniref:hypothetical protein n=1 Tax=Streptomyces atratus TaxID=1893 RepID=UPI0016705E3E|nr:hypothetical protein [Streptomyces atratus]WPW30172.1 hypothetical protein P6B95_24210 [Streptomyces atratus]